MQLNLSFPPSFPSNVAWHPPLIRKARTRCDLCRALHDFAWLRLTSQCLPSGNYGWRVWTQKGWLPIINLLIYERRPWNAHGQHSWTPWHHWLQHQHHQQIQLEFQTFDWNTKSLQINCKQILSIMLPLVCYCNKCIEFDGDKVRVNGFKLISDRIFPWQKG